MRKLLIIIMCMTCCATQVSAQSFGQKVKTGTKNFFKLIQQDAHPTGIHDPWDLYVGPRLGLDVSTLTNTGGRPVIGFTGGAFFEVFILKNLSIDMGLNYSRQGVDNVKYNITTNYADGTSETRHYKYDYALHYINTDYLLRWYPIASKPLSVYSGLHLARLFSAKAKSNHSNNIRDDLHKGDVSLPLGVSYEWGQWQADARYNLSVRHIGRSARAKQLLDDASNSMISFTVAYKILLW